MRIVFLLRKSSFSSWFCRFFQTIFTPTPSDVFNWSSLVNITQLYLKSLQVCYKKRLKIFSWNCQRNRTPLGKRLSQTPFSRFQSKTSNSLFFLKTITTCFEHDIFHNNPKDNVYGQVYSYKLEIAAKIGIHYMLFWGDNFTSENLKELPLVVSNRTAARNSTKLCHIWFHEGVLK